MRRGYMNGLMTGALIGGLVALWLVPQFRSNASGRLMAGGRWLGHRAHSWWDRGRDTAEDLMDRI
ncbi:MAG: YtxH domain-containing protein [Symbiobacteriia bacterium]